MAIRGVRRARQPTTNGIAGEYRPAIPGRTGRGTLSGMNAPRLSVLDLAPVVAGATPSDALRHTLDLAQHAERWGYHRFWLAEHHNMVGIASAATAVVI